MGFKVGDECIYECQNGKSKQRVVLIERIASMWEFRTLELLEGEHIPSDLPSSKFAWERELTVCAPKQVEKTELAIGDGEVGSAVPATAGAMTSRLDAPAAGSKSRKVAVPDIDAFWTDGDVRQWASEHELLLLGEPTIEEMRSALRCALKAAMQPKLPTPRIPTYRQITMTERSFLEPRMMG